MGAGGRDPQPALRHLLRDETSQPNHLVPSLGHGLAHLAADLDDGLVQLRLHLLPEDELVRVQDLGDVGGELPRLGVDDLVLLLDPDRERRRLHPITVSLGSNGGKRKALTLRAMTRPDP